MLQNLRESSQGIIAKVIVGFIIITFALWGVDSLVGLASDPGAPVTVNGVDITEAEIRNGIELQRRQLINQMGENVDPSMLEDNLLRGMVIEGLVEQSLILQQAEQQGLAVSQQVLDQMILNTREFQVDGQFDRDQFNAVLRNAGLTPMMYRELLRKEILMGQGQSAIAATAFALPSETQAVVAIDRQSRDIHYRVLTLEAALSEVNADAAEIEAYYQQNQADFMAAEQVSLEYIELNRADLGRDVEIDEAELQTQYQQLLETYEAQEARDAAHILIATSDERDLEQARNLASELRQQLDGGADFAALAAEHSDDPGSAADGGELGLVETGVMVPEFEEALFALQSGDISQPVETEFGVHLIKLNRIETGEPPSFEQARFELEAAQREQRSEARFVELSEQLADISFAAADLAEPAEALALPVQTTELFGREGGDDSLSSHPRVLKAAFSEDVLSRGHNSELIELDRDRVVVIRKLEHQPARAQQLSEVSDQISSAIKHQKAEARVMEQAGQLLAEAKALRAEQLAAEPWQQRQGLNRGDTELDSQLVSGVFKLAKPAAGETQWSVIPLSDGGAAVVGLSAVQPGADLAQTELQMMGGFLASRRGQADYFDLVSHLKATAEVERQ